MRNVLIDSSVWIDFLAGKHETEPMLELIDNNLICTNDLILTELLPFIIARKKDDLAEMLLAVTKNTVNHQLAGFKTNAVDQYS